MSAIAGIDYDTSAIFIATIDEETGRWIDGQKYPLYGGANSFERTRRIRHLIPSTSAWDNVTAAGIEIPFTHQKPSLIALSRILGGILAALPVELELIQLTPNRKAENGGWKALTVGATNASKNQIAAWATEHGAPNGQPQDLYDAFAIACAARSVLDSRERPIDLSRRAA